VSLRVVLRALILALAGALALGLAAAAAGWGLFVVLVQVAFRVYP